MLKELARRYNVEAAKKTTYKVKSESMKATHAFMANLARAEDFPNTYKIDSKTDRSCALEFTTSLDFETVQKLLKKVPREGDAMLASLKKK